MTARERERVARYIMSGDAFGVKFDVLKNGSRKATAPNMLITGFGPSKEHAWENLKRNAAEWYDYNRKAAGR